MAAVALLSSQGIRLVDAPDDLLEIVMADAVRVKTAVRTTAGAPPPTRTILRVYHRADPHTYVEEEPR